MIQYIRLLSIGPLFTMLLLLGLLVLALAPPLSGAESVCRLLGEALAPELEAEGDLIIGGIFTFRTGYKGQIPTFESLPNQPECRK